MKPRLAISFIIFLSAYAPLSLLFAVRDFDSAARWFHHPRFVFGVLGVAGVSLVFLLFAMSRLKGQFSIRVNRVALRSNDLIDYTIPYLISFFGVDFGKWQDITALGMFLLLLFALSYKTQSIFINPALALFGYGLYEVDFTEGTKQKHGVFLAKGDLIPNSDYKMERISRFLYIARL
jgi:hypothetical protein